MSRNLILKAEIIRLRESFKRFLDDLEEHNRLKEQWCSKSSEQSNVG